MITKRKIFLILFFVICFAEIQVTTFAAPGFVPTVIAKTGDLNITDIGRDVSINGNGKVAFLAKVPRSNQSGMFTDNIFVFPFGNPPILKNISPGIDGSFNNSFMPGIQVNDLDRILVRRRLEDSSPSGTIVSTYLDAWNANAINSFDRYVVGVPITGEFDGIFSYPSINNSNGIVFMATTRGSNFLATDTTAGAFSIGLSGELRRPMIADNNTFVMRSGASPYSVELRGPSFSLIRRIAGTANGFSGTNIGFSPAISDDGNIVVFYGEVLPASFPDTQDLNPGAGIFAAIKNGGNWTYKRMAGLRNNGYLDPGETYIDLNGNGQFDPPTEIDESNINGFFPNERVGVNNAGSVVFKTTDSLGIKSIQTNQINLSGMNFPVSTPILVASEGETLAGLGSPVQDIAIYDPISQSTPSGTEFAFWVSLQDGTQAVIKSASCSASLTSLSDETKNSFGGGQCSAINVTFEPTILQSPPVQIIDDNPDNVIPSTGGSLGMGKRIFPDKPTYNDNRNFKRIRVKAQTGFPNRPIYFRTFDVDDPSSATEPLDKNGSALGGDNRDTANQNQRGKFFAPQNANTCAISFPDSLCVRSDSNGDAIVEFEVGMAPGDNYRIGVAFDESALSPFAINEQNQELNSDAATQTLDGRVTFSPKLFVWRRLHIEVDSMGVIESNHIDGEIKRVVVGSGGKRSLVEVCPTSCPSNSVFKDYEFENGKIIINGYSYKVIKNIGNTLVIEASRRFAFSPGASFTLYDDDNLCGNGNGDEGCDIQRPDLSLVQNSDSPTQNIFAHAYITPEYDALINYTTEDVTVAVNVEDLGNQIDLGRGTSSLESNDFWIVYLQGGYQGQKNNDWDPNGEAGSPGALTTGGGSDDVENTAPIGGYGTVIYQETIRDKKMSTEVQAAAHPGGTAAHELGHQFGLKGDNCLDARVDPRAMACQSPGGEDFGIMSFGSSSYFFAPVHLSKLRSRVLSPGTPEFERPNQNIPPSINDSSIGNVPQKKQSNILPKLNEVKVLDQNLLAGDLDTTFDLDGKATTDINTGKYDFAFATTIQPNGKIIVVGDTDNGTNTDFGIVRYNTDGSLDTTFGSGGKAIIPFGTGFDFVNAVAVQSDGKIIIGGYTETSVGNIDFALTRLQSNGTLDTSFGTSGKIITDIGGIEDQIVGLVLQPDGKILVAGATDNGVQSDIALARYNPDGTSDSTFDNDGIVVTSFNNLDQFASDIALQSDGKIVITGETENGSDADFFVARYQTNGTLDNTFGTNGRTITDFSNSEDSATSLLIQADGQIVVGGYTGNLLNPDFALARYNTDGTLDNTFGTSGKVATDFAGNAEFINDISIRNSGIIVAVGHSYNNTNADLAVAEYLPTGILNSGFGSGGKVMTPIGASDDFGIATVIQPDNKIVVAGASFNGANDDFAVARYLAAAPTAAAATIGGQVLTADGRGIPRAVLILTDSNGITQTARTNSFGYFRFDEIRAGETYVVEVRHKTYRFAPQVITVNEDISDLSIVATNLFGNNSNSSENCFICNLESFGKVDLDYLNRTAFDRKIAGGQITNFGTTNDKTVPKIFAP